MCFLFHSYLLSVIVISTHSICLCPSSLTRRAGRKDVAYLEYNYQLVLNHHSYEDKSETRKLDITKKNPKKNIFNIIVQQ